MPPRRLRKEQRKPWPYRAKWQYQSISRLARFIKEYLDELQRNGVYGPQNNHLFYDLLPLSKACAQEILSHCDDYFRMKNRRGFARWAGWAVSDIEEWAAIIIEATDSALHNYHYKNRNMAQVKVDISEAMTCAQLILDRLDDGPGPPEYSDVEQEVIDMLAESEDRQGGDG